MNLARFICFFYLLISGLFGGVVMGQDDELILWEEHTPLLTWDNFKGEPEGHHDCDALTHYEIKFISSYNGETGEMKFVVYCFFNQDQSWVKEDPTDRLLKHEQGHFDLAEIYARKLRKTLEQRTFNPETMQEEVAEIYNKIMRDCRIEQEHYDHDTDHSKNEDRQAIWDEKFARDLHFLSIYPFEYP